MAYVFFYPYSIEQMGGWKNIFKPKNWGGWFSILTTWATDGPCHCGIIDWDIGSHLDQEEIEANTEVLHAVSTVRIEYLEDILMNYKYSKHKIVRILNPQYHHDLALNFAKSQIGTWYDILGCLSLIRVIFYKLVFQKQVSYKYQCTWLWYCSEYCKRCTKEGKLHPPENPMSPKDFLDFLENNNNYYTNSNHKNEHEIRS